MNELENNIMKEIERKNLMAECDMLEGNINRMMVTDDFKELEQMFTVALNRVITIRNKNMERLIDQNKHILGDK